MKMPKTAFATLAAAFLATLAFAAAAMAEETIPPGNSAVNQYTESLPTPGGARDTENDGRKSRPSPHKALGSKNANKLESQGNDGRAAAEVAAATAPTPEPADEEETAAPAASGGNGGGNNSNDNGPKPSDRGGNGADKANAGNAKLAKVEVEEPSGSSGLGEVVGEATGDSSGAMGWLLPLLIIAIAIWAVAYAMRQRRQAS